MQASSIMPAYYNESQHSIQKANQNIFNTYSYSTAMKLALSLSGFATQYSNATNAENEVLNINKL